MANPYKYLGILLMFGLHYISLIMHELSMDIITDGIKQCHCQQMSACYVLSSIAICATLVHICMNHYFTCSEKYVVINCIYNYIQGFSLTPVRLHELDMKLVSFPDPQQDPPPVRREEGLVNIVQNFLSTLEFWR